MNLRYVYVMFVCAVLNSISVFLPVHTFGSFTHLVIRALLWSISAAAVCRQEKSAGMPPLHERPRSCSGTRGRMGAHPGRSLPSGGAARPPQRHEMLNAVD